MRKIKFWEGYSIDLLAPDKPIIAVMASVEDGKHDIGANYLVSLEIAGAENVVVYDWDNAFSDLKKIAPHAILLPSGACECPAAYYGESGDNSGDERYRAYAASLEYAQTYELPIIAINGAAQVMAGFCGARLIKELCDENSHQDSDLWAHGITMIPGTHIYKEYGPTGVVNSRHTEAIDAANMGNCELMAFSDNSLTSATAGVVEAFSCPTISDFAYGYQFNPEDIAAEDKVDEDVLGCRKLFESFIKAAIENM